MIDVPTTPDEVEAEFERLTGIKPEKLVPRDLQRPLARVKAKPKPKASLTRERIINDFLDRGLGDYLCEMDEDLSAKLDSLTSEDRPRTDEQKRKYAEAHYAGAAAPALPARQAAPAADEHADANFGFPDRLGEEPRSQPAPQASGGSNQPQEPAEDELPGAGTGAMASVCIDGLQWRVDISEADARVTATVVFGGHVWRGLQGSSGEMAAFKDAVDFELSELQLRVLHVGTRVLELALPRPVDPSAAGAKISSQRRRVVVRAPLR